MLQSYLILWILCPSVYYFRSLYSFVMEPPRRPMGRARGRSVLREQTSSSSMSESSASTAGRVPGASAMPPPFRPASSMSSTASDMSTMQQQPARPMTSASSVSSMEVYSQGSGKRRRAESDVSTVCTRPRSLNSKKGITGQLINLTSNYFKLCKVTECILYQYHVDFEPEEDRHKVLMTFFCK
jgi:hypothetical protein